MKIAEQFETSKEFWATLVERGMVSDPGCFIQRIPHMSFVHDEEIGLSPPAVRWLDSAHLFRGMQYSENSEQLRQWMPLMMDGRDPQEKVAATRMEIGTDVNFGALTRALFASLASQEEFDLHCSHEIRDIDRGNDGEWHISVKDLPRNKRRWISASFVFIGAGGGALHLLEKSDIPEARGYGGFPVSGQWLICQNSDVVARHAAKVYGKAAVGAPPMSVPHLPVLRRVAGEE